MASFRASNTLTAGTRTNSTLTKPTGTASGDLLVMFFNIESDVLPVPPTGWRAGYNIDHSGAAVDQWVFWKRAGASEPASYTITHSSTWTNGYIVAVQSASATVNPSFSTPAQGTGTTATANGVTTVGANAWVGFFVNTFGDHGAVTPPSGTTPTFTERYESTNNVYAADGTLASAGSTGTKSVTFGASQQWMATLMVVEDAATTGVEPFVVQPAHATLASASPSVTFNVPVAENDIVVMWASSTTAAAIGSVPSGWVNPLGGTTMVNSDSHALACVYHVVTAAEETAQTLTYTATNLFNASETGFVHAALVRNVDPTTPLDDAASTFNSGNAITPHVLAGLTGTNLSTGSIVLSCVAKDATGTYSVLPSGWEFLVTSNTNQGMATLRREANTTSGTDVTATNITPSAGDEYCSITVALTAGPTGPAPSQGSATGSIAWVGGATGARTSAGAASGSVARVGSATGAKVSSGSSSGTVARVGSATGESPVVGPNEGAAAGSIAWVGTVTGTRTSSGSATGTVTYSGAATGVRRPAGAATGTVTRTGSATGSEPAGGAATGSIAWVGSATGEAPTVGVQEGEAAGTIVWAGSATGAHVSAGNATGTVARVGTATGVKTTTGTATGTVTWVGSAVGEMPTVGVQEGSASGTVARVGTVTGQRHPAASTTGTITWIGSVTGTRSSSGEAVGAITWVGEATSGQMPPIFPPLTTVAVTSDRTTTADGDRRTLVATAARTLTTVGAQRTTTPTSERFTEAL